MKKIKITALFLSLLLSLSCEEIGIIEEDLPFVSLYEVDGQISPGEKTPTINFTKSIPINESFDIKKVALDNVNAYIWSDTQGIIPLIHIGNGSYQPLKSKSQKLQIKANAVYELYADINGTRVYAKTKVPSPPEVIDVKIIQNYIECEISGKEGEVYSCIYIVQDGFQLGNPRIVKREKNFFSVEGDGKAGIVKLRTGDIPPEYLNTGSDLKVGVEVYAWDKAYKDYFKTKDNNKPIDDIFSQGGGLVNWNVYGENTIGLFMGYAIKVIMDF